MHIENKLKKLLVGSWMVNFSYGETFDLFFCQDLHLGKTKRIQLRLILDTLCWIGDRQDWIRRLETLKSHHVFEESEDCLLAFELARLRYNNLIQVKGVYFYDDSMAIEFPEGNILHVRNYAESDYAWVLEEVALKAEQERMSICCQDNLLYQNNLPDGL